MSVYDNLVSLNGKPPMPDEIPNPDPDKIIPSLPDDPIVPDIDPQVPNRDRPEEIPPPRKDPEINPYQARQIKKGSLCLFFNLCGEFRQILTETRN